MRWKHLMGNTAKALIVCIDGTVACDIRDAVLLIVIIAIIMSVQIGNHILCLCLYKKGDTRSRTRIDDNNGDTKNICQGVADIVRLIFCIPV